jgi:hypothetical protein
MLISKSKEELSFNLFYSFCGFKQGLLERRDIMQKTCIHSFTWKMSHDVALDKLHSNIYGKNYLPMLLRHNLFGHT